MSTPLRIFLGLIVFSLTGSLLTRLTGLNAGPIGPIASALTITFGIVATFREFVHDVQGSWLRIGAALILGTAAEIVGLATHFPFGEYVYTERWWPTVSLPGIGPFPLLLPFAWLLMAGAACLCFGALKPWPRLALGGLLAALVDLAMEPVMAERLNYWQWIQTGPLPGHAPWSNFLGWWAVSTAAGAFLSVRTGPIPQKTPRWVLGGFLVLTIGLGVVGPASEQGTPPRPQQAKR